MKSTFFLLFSLTLVGITLAIPPNNRPVIGILTQPTDEGLAAYGASYIAASYVKYAESAGAQVVPIFHNSTDLELKTMFYNVNGILYPGGGSNTSRGTQLNHAATYLYNLTVEANSQGDYFPMFGHCQGFELLTMIASGNNTILEPVDAENISLPLTYVGESSTSSRIFGSMPENVVNIFSNSSNNVTMNNHVWGVYPPEFTKQLGNVFDALTTSTDREGRVFVSTFEAFDYPIYGIQWHAEKPLFEWDPQEVINHSGEAVLAMSSMAQFFISESRKNHHTFPDLSEYVIYNYNPIFTETIMEDFEQCYIW